LDRESKQNNQHSFNAPRHGNHARTHFQSEHAGEQDEGTKILLFGAAGARAWRTIYSGAAISVKAIARPLLRAQFGRRILLASLFFAFRLRGRYVSLEC